MSTYLHCVDCAPEFGCWRDPESKCLKRPLVFGPGTPKSPFADLKRGEFYERTEDMSPDGRLAIFIQDDGDIIVTCHGYDGVGDIRSTSVEFCTIGSGGGRSPKVRAALLDLARAIIADNGGKPTNYEPWLKT